MLDSITFLDPNSEMIALASCDNTKNLLVTAFEIKGPFEDSLFKAFVKGALEKFPLLRSHLREIRKNGRYHLYWQTSPDIEFPLDQSDLKDYNASTPILEAIINHLSPRLDRNWDLFEEPPGEVRLVKLTRHHHVVVAVIHHAVFDAATASEFGRHCFVKYRELLTGVKDDFPGLMTHGLSTSRKRTVKIRPRKWRDIIQTGRLAIMPLISKPQEPAGSGVPSDQRHYHIKRVLTEEETKRIALCAPRSGGSFVDILVASSHISIDRWNHLRNAETGTITTALTVNIRGRYQSLEHSNNVSALFFESRSEERNDPKKLVHSLSANRIRQFRKQMDLKQYENVARMISCLSVMPFNMRRKVTHKITLKHKYSIAITLLGVVWPVMKNGKPTLDSYPTYVGETQITEIYGTGYKPLTSTPLLLIVYSFVNRLNFILAASASLFTREEADDFMDLFVDILRNVSEGSNHV